MTKRRFGCVREQLAHYEAQVARHVPDGGRNQSSLELIRAHQSSLELIRAHRSSSELIGAHQAQANRCVREAMRRVAVNMNGRQSMSFVKMRT